MQLGSLQATRLLLFGEAADRHHLQGLKCGMSQCRGTSWQSRTCGACRRGWLCTAAATVTTGLSFVRLITFGLAVCELHIKPTLPSYNPGSGAAAALGSETGAVCAAGSTPAPGSSSGTKSASSSGASAEPSSSATQAASASGSGAYAAAASLWAASASTPSASSTSAAASALLRVSYSTRTEPETTVDVCMHCGREAMVQVGQWL